MSLLCYVTEQIKGDATSHGIAKPELTKFAAKIEERQSLAGFDHFPPPCLTKKKIFGFNYRLIAVEKRVGDHLVVVLLRLVIRGGNDYSDFLRDPPTWAGRYFEAELTQEKLTKWVIDKTRIDPPAPPPPLSEEESTFLWTNAQSEHIDDVMVCETHDWVESVSEPRILDRLIRLPELILQAIEGAEGEVQTLKSPSDERLTIQAYLVSGTRQCVLLGASYSDSVDQLASKGATWGDKLAGADVDKVLRYSQRSYPSLLCCDEDMWIAVQKDLQANLALSPEEAEILRASSLQDPTSPAFPLFINGRAGSGKSTLLHYLFAQCILRWSHSFSAHSAVASRPLYFASSRELLKVANDVVSSLLRANHEHLLASRPLPEPVMRILGDSFQDLLQFMRKAYGDEAEKRFPRSKYVRTVVEITSRRLCGIGEQAVVPFAEVVVA